MYHTPSHLIYWMFRILPIYFVTNLSIPCILYNSRCYIHLRWSCSEKFSPRIYIHLRWSSFTTPYLDCVFLFGPVLQYYWFTGYTGDHKNIGQEIRSDLFLSVFLVWDSRNESKIWFWLIFISLHDGESSDKCDIAKESTPQCFLSWMKIIRC